MVAALTPRLRRHHTSRVGALLAPRPAQDPRADGQVLAEDHSLPEDQVLVDHLVARNENNIPVLLLGGATKIVDG